MDWIVKLSESTESVTETIYDLILVMIDSLTKFAHFLSY